MKITIRRTLALASLLLCFCLQTRTHAQATIEAWVKRYEGTGNLKFAPAALAVDRDDNVIVTGYSYVSGVVGDYLTVKYSSTGELLWADFYNGSANGADEAAAVAVDSENNIIVTGKSYGFDLGPEDYLTIQYSSGGTRRWVKRYHGGGSDYARAVAVDADGNVIVTGSSAVSGRMCCLTIKYSSAGASLWTNRYNGPANGNARARLLAVDSGNNVFLAGGIETSGTYPDYLTLGISSAGGLLWARTYSGPVNEFDSPEAVALDPSNNVVVTGWSCATLTSSYDYLTIKYSSTGVPLWTKRFSRLATSNDEARAMAVDARGNVIVTGYSDNGVNYDYATIKYSSEGTPVWTNFYNGPANESDQAYAVVVDASGRSYVTGCSEGDMVTIGYSSMGSPLWTNRYSGPAGRRDEPRAMALDHRNNLIVTGRSYRDSDNYDLVTVKYLVVQPPMLTGLQLTNGAFQMQVGNLLQPGNLVIESSDDLAAWQPIFTNTTSTNLLFYTDPNAGAQPRRFYRAFQSP